MVNRPWLKLRSSLEPERENRHRSVTMPVKKLLAISNIQQLLKGEKSCPSLDVRIAVVINGSLVYRWRQ